jgi:photosystem II stability/assembly factor-like uncharacterized protein
MKPRKTALAFVLAFPALVACGPQPTGPGGATPNGGGAAVAGAVPLPDAGPPTPAGAPYQFKNVVILGGGFVTGIEFSPAKKDLVYARTDVGGAYRWDPQGKVWIPLTDHFDRMSNYMGIESLAPDPVDPNKVYAAVGTYSQSWAGNGAILRSNDQGNTWEMTELNIKMGGNELGRSNGERLAVDPNQTKVLFFGSRRNGLWKSEDGAVTWKKVESFPIKEDQNGLGIPFVVFDAKSGQKGKATPVVYAGFSRVKDANLFSSSDGGATWKPLPKQPTTFMPHHLDIDSKGTVYVVQYIGPGPHDRDEHDVPDGAVYKFEPKSATWTDITPAKSNPGADDKFGYGGLAVDQKTGAIAVSTLNRYAKGHNVYRSTDGGKTWKDLFAKSEWDTAGAQYLYWHRPKLDKPHWIGDVDIDPFDPGRVTLVTGAGLWISNDALNVEKDQPVHFRFTTEGLEETVVSTLLSPSKGPELFSGVGDICGFRHDDVTKPPADGMFNPPFNAATGLDFAEAKPEVVVRVGTLWNPGKHGAISNDGGKTWTEFASEPTEAKTGGSVAITADASTLLWTIKKEQAVVSKDLGKTWTKAEGLPVPAQSADWVVINLRPAADRVNPNKLYVYDSADGVFYVSSDKGAHFEKTATNFTGLPDYARASGSMKTVPGFEGHIWVTTGKELMRSVDSGKTFEAVMSTEASHAVGFGAPGPGRKYPAIYLIGKVGGKDGFFRSDDAGNTWVRINDDKHQFGFTGHITGDPKKYGRVYVGTGGRGILYGDIK